MKKLLFTFSAFTLLACSSPLDKKITIGEYKTVIEEIKEDNTQFTDEDFNRAGDLVAGRTFGAMMSGETAKVDMTYREVLEKAQKENIEKNKQAEAYAKKLKKLTDIFSIKGTDGKYINMSAERPMNPHWYSYEITAINYSDRSLKAFKGYLVFKNEKNEELLSVLLEETIDFPAGKELEAADNTIIFNEDKLTELKALPFSKIYTEWQPTFLIFEDGSRMDAPNKPFAL